MKSADSHRILIGWPKSSNSGVDCTCFNERFRFIIKVRPLCVWSLVFVTMQCMNQTNKVNATMYQDAVQSKTFTGAWLRQEDETAVWAGEAHEVQLKIEVIANAGLSAGVKQCADIDSFKDHRGAVCLVNIVNPSTKPVVDALASPQRDGFFGLRLGLGLELRCGSVRTLLWIHSG